MKRILILSNIVWTISNFRKYLIEDLIKNGYEVYCIADTDTFSTHSIKLIQGLGAHFIPLKTNRKGLNPFSEILYMFRLFILFKHYKPDIILSYTIKPNIFGSFVAMYLNISQIATINGLGSGLLKKSILGKFSFFLYKIALKHPRKVFFQNTDDRDYFIHHNLLERTKAFYVPGSGIDTEDFKECKRPSSDSKIVFLMVARLITDKGVLEYVEAAKAILATEYTRCEFLLAGHFDEGNPTAIKPSEVQHWEENGTIRYLGKTDTIKDFFIQADVIVLPSYREGLSRVLLEAASCQKPLIATNVPGCKELVNEGFNGFLCEPANRDSLIQAIKKMLSLSPLEHENFGLYSRNIVIKNFGKERVNTLYLDSIEEILK
jgi:glycosyltransferase involved in cell wall biosynthesis